MGGVMPRRRRPRLLRYVISSLLLSLLCFFHLCEPALRLASPPHEAFSSVTVTGFDHPHSTGGETPYPPSIPRRCSSGESEATSRARYPVPATTSKRAKYNPPIPDLMRFELFNLAVIMDLETTYRRSMTLTSFSLNGCSQISIPEAKLVTAVSIVPLSYWRISVFVIIRTASGRIWKNRLPCPDEKHRRILLSLRLFHRLREALSTGEYVIRRRPGCFPDSIPDNPPFCRVSPPVCLNPSLQLSAAAGDSSVQGETLVRVLGLKPRDCFNSRNYFGHCKVGLFWTFYFWSNYMLLGSVVRPIGRCIKNWNGSIYRPYAVRFTSFKMVKHVSIPWKLKRIFTCGIFWLNLRGVISDAYFASVTGIFHRSIASFHVLSANLSSSSIQGRREQESEGALIWFMGLGPNNIPSNLFYGLNLDMLICIIQFSYYLFPLVDMSFVSPLGP